MKNESHARTNWLDPIRIHYSDRFFFFFSSFQLALERSVKEASRHQALLSSGLGGRTQPQKTRQFHFWINMHGTTLPMQQLKGYFFHEVVSFFLQCVHCCSCQHLPRIDTMTSPFLFFVDLSIQVCFDAILLCYMAYVIYAMGCNRPPCYC